MKVVLEIGLLVFGLLVSGRLVRSLLRAVRNPGEIAPEERDRDYTAW